MDLSSQPSSAPPASTPGSDIAPASGSRGWSRPAIVAMGLVHLVAVLAVWFAPPTWPLVALAVASYFLRMFGITAGYHRYFAHRAYRTSRGFQFALACLGGSSAQRGALWWAAHHRDHHRCSDQPGDVHSPLRDGFWWSHIGWVLHTSSDATAHGNVRDFQRFPELGWLDRWHLVPPVAYATLLFAVGGLPWLLWGFFVSTVALWHGTFVINSLAHVWGSRRYETTDGSRNNPWLALLTLGEGWHNNHHHFQSAARQGFFWWELDVSYLALRLLAVFGIVWKLKAVPERLLHARPVEPVHGHLARAA
jgi:stearoyl-CoA desaturase (delta-9 desaturase)